MPSQIVFDHLCGGFVLLIYVWAKIVLESGFSFGVELLSGHGRSQSIVLQTRVLRLASRARRRISLGREHVFLLGNSGFGLFEYFEYFAFGLLLCFVSRF